MINRISSAQGCSDLEQSLPQSKKTYKVALNSLLSLTEKQKTQGVLLLATAVTLGLFFTTPIGLAAAAIMVSVFALGILLIQNWKSEETFTKECRQIDSATERNRGSIHYLGIDSLPEEVKNNILGKDLLEKLIKFTRKDRSRAKDLITLKNLLIHQKKTVTEADIRHSLKLNLDQIAIDIDRGFKVKLNGQELQDIPQTEGIESSDFEDLQQEYGTFYSPKTVKLVLDSIEQKYPGLSLLEKNILVNHLHHGVFFDIQKELSKNSMKATDYGAMDVKRNRDGSFSLEVDLLLKHINTELAIVLPHCKQEASNYKRVIQEKFGMKGLPSDEFLRSVLGIGKANIKLDFLEDKKRIQVTMESENDFFSGGDFQDVEL